MTGDNGQPQELTTAPTKEIAVSQQAIADLQVLTAALLDRASLASQAGLSFQGARDLWTELGYPSDLDVDSHYRPRYEREGLSGRIVDKPAEDSWFVPPKITDGEAEDTEFVKDLTQLDDRLKIWQNLTNLDRVAGIGRFGVLLIGTKGEGQLVEPIEDKLAGPDDLIYLRPFDEGDVLIESVVTDTADSRYGKPEIYSLDLGKVGKSSMSSQRVHWTRILHVAEDSTDGVTGVPRLQRSFNRLMDIDKVVGGSSEALWRLVLKGYALTEKAGYEVDPDAAADYEDEFLKYIHNLKRILVLGGVDVKELGSSETPDPSGIFKVLVSMVAADISMPQNILIGSEQGIRASDVDAATWARTIAGRQTKFVEPIILRPFIDWCIGHGALPEPTSGRYEVAWEPLFVQTESEIVETGKAKAETIAQIANSPAIEYSMVTPEEVRGWVNLPAEPKGTTIEQLLDIEDSLPEEVQT